MENNKFAILSVAEIKEELVQFYANFLHNDPVATLEMIRNGTLHTYVPNIPNVPDAKAVELYSELCLGEYLLNADASIDGVLVKLGDFQYELVAKQGQQPPPPVLYKLALVSREVWFNIQGKAVYSGRTAPSPPVEGYMEVMQLPVDEGEFLAIDVRSKTKEEIETEIQEMMKLQA
jgi:hypothetical protein